MKILKIVKGIIKVEWTCPNCGAVNNTKPEISAKDDWMQGIEESYSVPVPVVDVRCPECKKMYQVEGEA